MIKHYRIFLKHNIRHLLAVKLEIVPDEQNRFGAKILHVLGKALARNK